MRIIARCSQSEDLDVGLRRHVGTTTRCGRAIRSSRSIAWMPAAMSGSRSHRRRPAPTSSRWSGRGDRNRRAVDGGLQEDVQPGQRQGPRAQPARRVRADQPRRARVPAADPHDRRDAALLRRPRARRRRAELPRPPVPSGVAAAVPQRSARNSLYYQRARNGAGVALFPYADGSLAELVCSWGNGSTDGLERTVISSDAGRHVVVDNNLDGRRTTACRSPGYGDVPDFFGAPAPTRPPVVAARVLPRPAVQQGSVRPRLLQRDHRVLRVGARGIARRRGPPCSTLGRQHGSSRRSPRARHADRPRDGSDVSRSPTRSRCHSTRTPASRCLAATNNAS